MCLLCVGRFRCRLFRARNSKFHLCSLFRSFEVVTSVRETDKPSVEFGPDCFGLLIKSLASSELSSACISLSKKGNALYC